MGERVKPSAGPWNPDADPDVGGPRAPRPRRRPHRREPRDGRGPAVPRPVHPRVHERRAARARGGDRAVCRGLPRGGGPRGAAAAPRYGGVVMVGPIPLVFGSDARVAKWMMVLGIVLMGLVVGAFVFLSLRLVFNTTSLFPRP